MATRTRRNNGRPLHEIIGHVLKLSGRNLPGHSEKHVSQLPRTRSAGLVPGTGGVPPSETLALRAGWVLVHLRATEHRKHGPFERIAVGSERFVKGRRLLPRLEVGGFLAVVL